MRCGVRELIFLIISIREVDEDSKIVSAGRYPDACACEFGAQLVESAGCDTLDGTVDVKG